MLISYRITTGVIALVAGAIIFRLVRRNLLHGSYAAWWLSMGLMAVFVGIFPGCFDILGQALGVSYPPTLFIILVLATFAVRMLISDIERTRMELTQRRLVQRYAHMALRLRDLERVLLDQGISLPKPPHDSQPASQLDADSPDLADTSARLKPPTP